MRENFQDLLKSPPEPPRLIPVAAPTHRERQAASVFLATLKSVRPFAEEILGYFGRRMGPRTDVDAYTEVVFRASPNDRNIRPDGLLILDTGRSRWSALIEAKIGNARIGADQLLQYIELAKLHGIDSIITISNQFAAFPEHHPVMEANKIRNNFNILHISWLRIITIARLMLSYSIDELDESTIFIIQEMIRFLEHDNIGVQGFSSMTKHWPKLVDGIKAGHTFKSNDLEVVETIKSWHQEQQDICLILSRNLSVPVNLAVPRKYRDDYLRRIEDDARAFADSRNLVASFAVPNLAGELDVVSDTSARTIRCGMTVRSPEDRKTYESRLNWLLRQLPEELPKKTYVRAIVRGSAPRIALVSELREDLSIAKPDNPNVIPSSFEISVVTDLAGRFSGPETFIKSLEKAVPEFYDTVAKHIKAWRPPPPRGPATDGHDAVSVALNSVHTPEKIIKRGTIGGRKFAIFEDGSIQVETRAGIKWFKDLTSLKGFMDAPA